MVQAQGAACAEPGSGKAFLRPPPPPPPPPHWQCAAKPTMNNKNRACGVCCFLQCEYSPRPMSQDAWWRKDVCDWLSGAAASRPRHPAGPRPSLPRDTWRMEPEPWCPGQGKSPRDTNKTPGSFFNASSDLCFHELSTQPVLRWHLS